MWTYGEFNDSDFQTVHNPGTQTYHALVKIYPFILFMHFYFVFLICKKGFREKYLLMNELFVVVHLQLERLIRTNTCTHMQFMSCYGRTEARPKHSIADWQ